MIVDGYIVNINKCHVHCKCSRPISMRPDAMRPRPDRVRPRLRPNNLASRPHEPRGLNIPFLTTWYRQHRLCRGAGRYEAGVWVLVSSFGWGCAFSPDKIEFVFERACFFALCVLLARMAIEQAHFPMFAGTTRHVKRSTKWLFCWSCWR